MMVALAEYRSERKTDNASLYSTIDGILEKYKIYRSAYHSGQIKSMLPLSKPIRRDVSGGYLLKQPQQQPQPYYSTLTTSTANNTNTNWTFPIVNETKITNPSGSMAPSTLPA